MRARRQAILMCVFSALAVVVSAGLFSAAALVPAPPAVLPLVVAVCVGAPMLAAWELRHSVGALRRGTAPLDSTAIITLRRHLDSLPETQHPLGL
jgi:hypothetical protein